MKKLLAILLLAFVGLASAQDAQKLYEKESERILVQRDAGKLSALETTIELEAAGKAYFPTDTLLHAYHASVRSYAEQLQSGAITRERFLELHQQRTARFESALAERDAVTAAQQKANDQAASNAARSNYVGNLLRSMAAATNRTTGRPAVNCTSYTIGGSVSTACQ